MRVSWLIPVMVLLGIFLAMFGNEQPGQGNKTVANIVYRDVGPWCEVENDQDGFKFSVPRKNISGVAIYKAGARYSEIQYAAQGSWLVHVKAAPGSEWSVRFSNGEDAQKFYRYLQGTE